MIDLVERIGPALGIAAFLGLAVLAFLIFQQAREVRRLREWAGRAPERASEAAEASLAAAEARGESMESPAVAREGRLAPLHRLRDRVAGALRPAWSTLDEQSPVDPRYLLVVLAAAVVAVGVLTSGFGLVGGDDGKGGGKGGGAGKAERGADSKPKVAVLNATQTVDAAGVPVEGVEGLATKVANEVLKPADYPAGRQENASDGFAETVVMFEDGSEGDAETLAADVESKLGPVQVQPMISDVRALAGGADLALVVGQDDAQF